MMAIAAQRGRGPSAWVVAAAHGPDAVGALSPSVAVVPAVLTPVALAHAVVPRDVPVVGARVLCGHALQRKEPERGADSDAHGGGRVRWLW